MTAEQGIDAAKITRRRLRSLGKLLAFLEQAVEFSGLERHAVEVLTVTETQPDRDHVDAQPLDFALRQIGARIADDRDRAGVVQQPELAAHVIGFLLGDLAELLAGKVSLAGVVDMQMDPDLALVAGDHQ